MEHDKKLTFKNSKIINIFDRVIYISNLALVIIIFIVLLAAILMLYKDVSIMLTSNFNQGIGTALGSILVTWVLLELAESQIDHIKGHKIDISFFIIIVIVAFIRKLLVASIKSTNDQTVIYLVTIFVLSLVYWLIKYTNSRFNTK